MLYVNLLETGERICRGGKGIRRALEKWESGGEELHVSGFVLPAAFRTCVKNRQNVQKRNAGNPAIIRKVIADRMEAAGVNLRKFRKVSLEFSLRSLYNVFDLPV